LELINSFIDPRIKIIHHLKNLGEAETRNTAIKCALGRFLAFLDSDDEWLPEKLSHQMDILSQRHEEIIANVTGYYLFDEFGIRRKETPPHPSSWYKHLLTGCSLGPGTTMMVSRKAFDKIGYYDSSLIRYTDWDWLLRFAEFYPLTVTDEPLAVIYRASQPQARVVEVAAQQFLEKHYCDFQKFGYYGKRAIAKRYLEVAIYYFYEENKSRGWDWLLKALVQSPFQRPGMYFRVLDGLLGTSIVPALIRLRSRWSRVD
jgi:glycosyltransferase involved in cell wall biosynthesis